MVTQSIECAQISRNIIWYCQTTKLQLSNYQIYVISMKSSGLPAFDPLKMSQLLASPFMGRSVWWLEEEEELSRRNSPRDGQRCRRKSDVVLVPPAP